MAERKQLSETMEYVKKEYGFELFRKDREESIKITHGEIRELNEMR